MSAVAGLVIGLGLALVGIGWPVEGFSPAGARTLRTPLGEPA